MLRSAAHVLFGCLSEQKLFWQLKKNHVTISSLDLFLSAMVHDHSTDNKVGEEGRPIAALGC